MEELVGTVNPIIKSHCRSQKGCGYSVDFISMAAKIVTIFLFIEETKLHLSFLFILDIFQVSDLLCYVN